jgi:hypothetical protein
VKPPILAVIVFSSAVCGLAQPAQTGVDGRYVIGLDNLKRNSPGKLTLLDGALQFQAGKTNSKVAMASIDDVFIGTETTQAGGKGGTVAKTAAMAAPYGSGAALHILLRTNVDILTVANRDSSGGLHYLILALPKGQGETQRTQLITAGAHVVPPSGQELKEQRPAAPEVQKTNRQKFSASAIQIEPVGAGDVLIPAEFRAAVYEFLVIRMRESGAFQKVFRSGDREAAGVPDLVTLRTTVEKFTQGSQMKREITTVLGATKLDVGATVTGRDGHLLLDGHVHGKVRFFGENLGVTNDIAKRIAKLLKQG